ncbi:hypothetical protein FPV67DRAFT_92922 [Lyophyllum atratum]|nr:hypothetical protein FPV67DRAFT_92922 [Lyophyllum atratum]
MENDYPVLSSLSTPFLDYDEFDSAGPTSADSPTFCKLRESSHLADRNAVFHPPPSDAFKVWRSEGPPCYDDQSYSSSSSTPYHQMSNEGHGDWTRGDEMDVAMDMSCYDEESYLAQASPQYPETQWPTWESTNRLRSSIPTSAARSSLSCSPSRQNSSGTFWLGSQYEPEHDPFGPESPPPLGTLFDMSAYVEDPGNHAFYTEAQPHNNPHDSTESPYSYAFPASSSASSSRPTVSPLASPASQSSLSTPPSSSPDIIMHAPTLVLHQPRPGRPIPIIPLSELASACEEFYMPPSSTRTNFSNYDLPGIRLEPSNLLSPLSSEFQAHYMPSYSPKPTASLQDSPNGNPPYIGYGDDFDDDFSPMNAMRYSYLDGGPEIFCACGCKESYRISHSNSV